MVLTLLAHLPASVLEMVAAALLIGAIGIVIIVFTALVSEVACRRIIRLVNALAKLTNKDFRAVRHRRNEHSK
jgi:hypothetical protein